MTFLKSNAKRHNNGASAPPSTLNGIGRSQKGHYHEEKDVP